MALDFLGPRVFTLISTILPRALLPIGQKVFITLLTFYFLLVPSYCISLTGSIHSWLPSKFPVLEYGYLFIYLTSFPPAELLCARLPGTEAALAAGQAGDEFPRKKERKKTNFQSVQPDWNQHWGQRGGQNIKPLIAEWKFATVFNYTKREKK